MHCISADIAAAKWPGSGALQQHPVHLLAAVASAPPAALSFPVCPAAPHRAEGRPPHWCAPVIFAIPECSSYPCTRVFQATLHQYLCYLKAFPSGVCKKSIVLTLSSNHPSSFILPGVDKRSVDTWMHPNIFHMQFSTGAPPDYFDANGQNWGFPTYNWEEMAKDGYQWWRQRLTTMSQCAARPPVMLHAPKLDPGSSPRCCYSGFLKGVYACCQSLTSGGRTVSLCTCRYFHAYRIDHILGFFRIWEIPGDCTLGLLGHFRPSHPITRQELEAHGIWDFDR